MVSRTCSLRHSILKLGHISSGCCRDTEALEETHQDVDTIHFLSICCVELLLNQRERKEKRKKKGGEEETDSQAGRVLIPLSPTSLKLWKWKPAQVQAAEPGWAAGEIWLCGSLPSLHPASAACGDASSSEGHAQLFQDKIYGELCSLLCFLGTPVHANYLTFHLSTCHLSKKSYCYLMRIR